MILRDGEFRCLQQGKAMLREEDGVLDALAELKAQNLLQQEAWVHLADYRKQTNRTIRFWLRGDKGQVHNPLEGTSLLTNRGYLVLATTGAATLIQGTIHPIAITGNGHCPQIVEAGRSLSMPLN